MRPRQRLTARAPLDFVRVLTMTRRGSWRLRTGVDLWRAEARSVRVSGAGRWRGYKFKIESASSAHTYTCTCDGRMSDKWMFSHQVIILNATKGKTCGKILSGLRGGGMSHRASAYEAFKLHRQEKEGAWRETSGRAVSERRTVARGIRTFVSRVDGRCANRCAACARCPVPRAAPALRTD